MSQHDEFNAFRQLDFRHVDGMTSGQVGQVHLDELRQIFGQAVHVRFGHDVVHGAAGELDAGGDVRIDEVQRHLHVHLLILIHALEVNVQHQLAEGMHLVIAQHHLFLGGTQAHGEDGGVEGFATEGVKDFVVVEFDHGDILSGTVNDGRDFAFTAETAARTRSLHRTQACVEFVFHLLLQDIDK